MKKGISDFIALLDEYIDRKIEEARDDYDEEQDMRKGLYHLRENLENMLCIIFEDEEPPYEPENPGLGEFLNE